MVVNFVGPHGPMDITQNMRAECKDITIPIPHDPIVSEEESSKRARRNYGAMIENIDRLAGRFVEKVKRRGEYDNTVIVYASDHGDMLGDHGKWGKGTWRDPSVRVPLIIRDPFVRHRGVRSDALVSLQDLAATFLDFASCSKLAGMDSISLRPLLTDKCIEHREVLVSELGDWKLVFDGRYKLVVRSGRSSLLFDLEADRFEDHDIGSKRMELIADLSRYAAPAV
jgi:arylsulfatase A-like enzyme